MNPYLTPYTEINTKQSDLKSQKSWKEIRQKPHDIGFGCNFLDMTPKAQATKQNGQIELQEKFLKVHQKNINIIKRQSTEWEKIFGNHTSEKGLVSRT